MRIPTKAKLEFEDDCSGHLFKSKSSECQKCLVSAVCKRGPEKVSREPVESLNEDSMKRKNKKDNGKKPEKIDVKDLKPVDIKKLSKKYRNDNENCGARENTAHWAIFKVLSHKAYKHGKPFTTDELAKDVSIFCKQMKIKFDPDAKLPKALPYYASLGVIARTEKRGVYVKMIS